MPHAVIVAHGQPSAPQPAEAALANLAARINRLTDRVTVGSATLAAPNALESMLDGLPSGSVIYPLFMAKGWFVTTALPKRIGTRTVRQMDPLGTDPHLPALVAEALRPQIAHLGWQPESTDLLIAAHGSGRSRNPSQTTTSFARQLGDLLPLQSIRCGFVEEPPSISDAALETGTRSICLPFFACRGGHVLDDLPNELNCAGFSGHVLPIVGEMEPIHKHIARQLDRAFDV